MDLRLSFYELSGYGSKNKTMKKALLFIGGFVTGIVVTILVVVLINAVNQPNDGFPGLTVFPEKGECITTSGKIEVFQVLAPNVALAWTGDFLYSDRILVLLINYEGKSYYDEQKITHSCQSMCKTNRNISIHS